MVKNLWRVLFLVVMLAMASAVFAQESTETPETLPRAYRLQGLSYEAQMWNNCGPATMTNALTFFGYGDNQVRAQNFLKPNIEDKNVSPYQMVEFVNSHVPEIPVYAMQRVGGTIQLLKTLLANDFPVIIEEGYDPPPHNLGWMGHYLLMIGYDDSVGVFITNDSYEGPNHNYGYEHIEEFWQHFNYTYIVLYEGSRLEELNAILGEDADELANTTNALNIAIEEANTDNTDAFAWFNIGTNLVHLAELSRTMGDEAGALQYFTNAATAYNQARTIGLPWRMLWYQFGPYEAYFALAQANPDSAYLYDEITRLTTVTIQNCANPDGVCYVEETYYWAGRAREAMGERDRALTNYNTALQINSNFQPAIEARDALLGN